MINGFITLRSYWKMVLTIAPICGAVLIAGSLTIDEYHNCKHEFSMSQGRQLTLACFRVGLRWRRIDWYSLRYRECT